MIPNYVRHEPIVLSNEAARNVQVYRNAKAEAERLGVELVVLPKPEPPKKSEEFVFRPEPTKGESTP